MSQEPTPHCKYHKEGLGFCMHCHPPPGYRWDEESESCVPEGTEEPAEPAEPMPAYEPKTDEQIKEIGQKLQAGHIYTSEHVKQGDDVGLVFMAFALSARSHADWMQENAIAVLYQDLEKAAPRSINGMPCFFSHQLLTLAEWKRVQEIAQKIQEAVDSV